MVWKAVASVIAVLLCAAGGLEPNKTACSAYLYALTGVQVSIALPEKDGFVTSLSVLSAAET